MNPSDTTKVCNQGICPKGYYCPEGTSLPVACPLGKFNLNFGEVSIAGCINCIQGYYCPTKTSKIVCSAGTICPETSSATSLPSAGYYSLN